MGTFPKDVIFAAEAAQAQWLVPSSVTLAQWALESDYGLHEPPGSNNPFGIKAVAGEPYVEAATHEVIDGKSVETTAKFAKYANLTEAFDAHGRLLGTHKAYARAMALRMNADDFANALTGVYATDPRYGAKLIDIMRTHHLYDYDKLPAEAPAPVAPAPAPTPAAPVVTLHPDEQITSLTPHADADHGERFAPPASTALLASIDQTITNLLALKAQLKNIQNALHGLVGE